MARPKSQITVTSRAEQQKNRIAAITRENPALARRLASGNPFANGSKEIPLREPEKWHTYLANNEADSRAFYKMKYNGWIPLTEDDLACPLEESGFVKAPDGSLRSPDNKDMLFKMDVNAYRTLEAMKTAANSRGIGSASQVKSDMADAAGRELGDEAGSFIHGLDGKVIDTITGGDAS